MDMVFCRGCGKQIHKTAYACPSCGATQAVDESSNTTLKSQTAAGLWCVFLGQFGAHWFYLGKTTLGVLSLLFFWTAIPGIVAFINAIQIAFIDAKSWSLKYNNGTLMSPVHWVVKVLAIVFPIIGILSWIAILG